MPEVSVIIPNYNHAIFLRDRIESVLNQTFTDFEIILLDDASTDHSMEVIAQYLDHPKITFYPNNINSGSTFKQWNKGIAFAKGKYIWLAESDDKADPTFLSRLVDILSKQAHVGLAKCLSIAIDNEGKLGQQIERNDVRDWMHDFTVDGIDECRFQIEHGGCLIENASAVLFRKDIYVKAAADNGSYRLSGDWLTWLSIMTISDFAHIAAPLNYFRVPHNSSVRKKHYKGVNCTRHLEDLKVVKHIFNLANIPSATQAVYLERYTYRWSATFFQPTRFIASFRQHLQIISLLFNMSPYWLLTTIKHTVLAPFLFIKRRLK